MIYLTENYILGNQIYRINFNAKIVIKYIGRYMR